jgi:hypothetical protein
LIAVTHDKPSNAGLQLRRAITIQAERKTLVEKHAIAPSAARPCYAAAPRKTFNVSHFLCAVFHS